MEYDNEALDSKRQELRRLVRQAVPASTRDPERIAESVLSKFIQITPPTKPEMLIEMITAHSSGSGGGRSRKPGNIYLNWAKLMDLVPDITIAAVGGATSPHWLLPFIGLYVWNKLWCSSKEELTETEATVICALWKNRNNEHRITEDTGFEKTNVARTAMELAPLSRNEFDGAVNRLLEMKCIEIKGGVIWLREWVCIRY